MKKFFKQCLIFLSSLKIEHVRWMITVFFSVLFAWSMYLEAYRTLPAVSLLMGAITTNLPTVVLLFYVTVVIAHNFVNIRFVRGKGSVELSAVDQKRLSELEAEAKGLSSIEEEDVEVLIVETDEVIDNNRHPN